MSTMEQQEILALAKSVEAFAIEARRHIHANPELSMREVETAAYVADSLRQMGYQPETGIAGEHGVRAVLRGGKPGPTIGLRADMDALPITEANDLEFRSRNTGVMHACGHDCHTAILLATAKALKQVQESLAGNVVFIFQPCEEMGPGGAQSMVDAGVMRDIDAVFALHVAAAADAGRFGFIEGASSASCAGLKITVTGRGGHAAHPETTIDPVVVAGHVIVALQQIVSRQVGPLDSVVVTIGTIHAGTKSNIIADQVVMEGTVRTLDAKQRDAMPERIRRIVSGVCEAFGAHGDLEYSQGCPSCVNDSAMVEFARRAATLAVGADRIDRNQVSLGGEDFACMLAMAPGAIGSLGVADPATPFSDRAPIHNAHFMADESALAAGVAYFVALATLAGAPDSPVGKR